MRTVPGTVRMGFFNAEISSQKPLQIFGNLFDFMVILLYG